MKKWICLILSSIFAVSALTSCKDNEESSPPNTEYTPYEATLGGESATHKNDSVKTSDFLVKDGKTSYQILYPADAAKTVLTAVDELKLFFKEATDIALTAVSDAEYDAAGNYLSVGETKLLAVAELTVDKALLGEQGAQVRTKNKSVFMCGASDLGTLYSVYEFYAAHLATS